VVGILPSLSATESYGTLKEKEGFRVNLVDGKEGTETGRSLLENPLI